MRTSFGVLRIIFPLIIRRISILKCSRFYKQPDLHGLTSFSKPWDFLLSWRQGHLATFPAAPPWRKSCSWMSCESAAPRSLRTETPSARPCQNRGLLTEKYWPKYERGGSDIVQVLFKRQTEAQKKNVVTCDTRINGKLGWVEHDWEQVAIPSFWHFLLCKKCIWRVQTKQKL